MIAARPSACGNREGSREIWPEAIAWLELAAAQNHAPARALLDRHQSTLTPEEIPRAAERRKDLGKP